LNCLFLDLLSSYLVPLDELNGKIIFFKPYTKQKHSGFSSKRQEANQ
jgi:hypothetical protein